MLLGWEEEEDWGAVVGIVAGGFGEGSDVVGGGLGVDMVCVLGVC